MKHTSKAATVTILLVVTLLQLAPTVCSLSSAFYKFGIAGGDSVLPKAEEAGDLINLKGASFLFYGKSHTKLVLYDNGYIGIGGGTGSKTPRPFPFSSFGGMVAPFWADVDTNNFGAIYYRETQTSSDLIEIATDIQSIYSNSFMPTSAFIATWDGVGYCCSNSDVKTNSFQAVLASDGTQSYVIFKYGQIEYTTGDLSGGTNGVGGSEASAGLNRGDAMEYVVMPDSGTPSVIDIGFGSNIGVEGIYMFRTDPSLVAAAPFMLYPYGVSEGDTVLPSASNANSGPISLSNHANVFGVDVSQLIVYEDGYISINGVSGLTTPQSFPFSSNNPIIAPFWIDGERTGDVYYREETDTLLLKRAMSEVGFTHGGNFVPSSLFIVTWTGMEPVGSSSSPNKFQVVIATDASSSQSFVIFLYDDINWSASASGSAQAGMNAGDGKTFFKFPGSGSSDLEDLDTTSSTGIPGYHVRCAGNAELYPFGEALMDRTLGHVDFHSLYASLRKSSLPFYGANYNSLRVYSNGYIILGGSYGGYCPSSFPVNKAMIAPYWADADTRSGVGGIYFRETSDFCQIDRAAEEIRSFTGDNSFRPTSLIVVTYDTIGYTQMKIDKLNTFQAVIATDGTTSHIIYIYKDLQWTSSDICGGSGGLGGSKIARAGINAGDGVRFNELIHSGTSSVLNLDELSNVGVNGFFLLQNTESSVGPARANLQSYQSKFDHYQMMDRKIAAAMAEETQLHDRLVSKEKNDYLRMDHKMPASIERDFDNRLASEENYKQVNGGEENQGYYGRFMNVDKNRFQENRYFG